jgi:hypothetical protein
MRNEELEHSFYAKEFNLSYTSLSLMMDSPLQFYKDYVLKEKEIKSERYFTKGKIIHYLMLDNGMFDEHFILASNGIPSENTEKVLRIVLTRHLELKESGEEKGDLLEDYKEEILDILKAMNLHQALVDDKKHPFITGDQKRIEKVIDEKSKSYFTFLLNQGNREIIDPDILEKCMVTAELLKADKNICMLLGLDLEGTDSNYGVYNELYHQMNIKDFPFGLHGVIDNMVVDVRNKTVRINDLKTTSKSVSDFQESVTKYKYWMQAVIYAFLAKSYLKDVVDKTWRFEIRFIVVDKYNQYYAFPVSMESIKIWSPNTIGNLHKAKYHYENRDYSLPYEFLAGKVEL